MEKKKRNTQLGSDNRETHNKSTSLFKVEPFFYRIAVGFIQKKRGKENQRHNIVNVEKMQS